MEKLDRETVPYQMSFDRDLDPKSLDRVVNVLNDGFVLEHKEENQKKLKQINFKQDMNALIETLLRLDKNVITT